MNTNYPIGKCKQMCPDEEIIRRERDGLLHIFEILPCGKINNKPKANINHVVKEFRRSAAGRIMEDENCLRTPEALLQTLDYLLHSVITRTDVNWHIVYDFIMDRLRAIRQDMVIQNLPRAICISLLQPMIKFYVYAGYRLCEEPISVYDPHINYTHLQECLKRLLCIYDEMDVLVKNVNKNGSDIKYNDILLYSETRSFMEALYLILNLANTTAMERAIHLPNVWKTPLVKKCLNISINCMQKNFVRVCREIQTLPILLQCYFILNLPIIRKKMLNTMSIAYSSKVLTYPADNLKNILLYNDVEEIINECRYYEIEINNQNIKFFKQSFNSNKPESLPKHNKRVDEQLANYNVSYLLLEEIVDEELQ